MAPPDPAYVVDPADPRAPSEERWACMSVEERARVVDLLPPAEKHLAAEAAIAEERKRAEAAEAKAEAAEVEKQRAEAEKQRAETEKQRAEARLAEALAELEKLRGR
ncbi:hypothetical protein [Polyangium jinanense]|uniref:Uncharacterized protein n=1 Tax=Polyangium jinanense TaxID=2829994 RepID=A0A9X3WXV0_9BACT|nr:hypothetical protein [Polyangium jinanense]MDC3953669.1 hypothetical protein [Polyangium jinanense]MDC3979210.1 hypothetical protein [Polyangium jinanense]